MSGYYYSNPRASRNTKTISVTSGKGGVGKSTLISNLATYLSTKGNRVLILDGDLGMSNVDIMFNKRATKNLMHLLNGENEISEIITPLRTGVDLVSGGSGIYDLQDLNSFQKKALLDQLDFLRGQYDYLLIDTAPGIADNVLYLNAAADEILVILTPDPSSLTDAYALIKVLNQRYKVKDFSVVCNLMKDEAEALTQYKRLSDVAMQFLNVRLDYKGFIPSDLNMRRATKLQQLVLNYQPRCPSSFAIRHLGENLKKSNELSENKPGVQVFWQQLVGVA